MLKYILIIFIALNLAAENSKPNIIFMMADDMGMGDTSAFQKFTGNSDEVQIHTPQMDKLASIGTIFTDAHTPSSRCTLTRYSLLTGRYSWRNRLKHWVLYGNHGDPMIERDRPTLASMLKQQGYSTAIVGKWHVGLRYTRSDGKPADGWKDADFTKPMHTTPLDHGFDFVRFTSRSHATSGPDMGKKNKPKVNKKGPGHIHGRTIIGATGKGKSLVTKGPNAYILKDLGRRHSESAMEFLNKHISDSSSKKKPFFLYYPSNSNHSPYTPSPEIGGVKVKAKTKAGKEMDMRHDYVYENDVALGRLINWLEEKDDPRNSGKKLIENTIVIFTSDNGAEKKLNGVSTGPFRSNKASVYEGGHRVPFIVSWPAGGIGKGKVNKTPISLTDMFATFAEITGSALPDLSKGEKGAEDSVSILKSFRGETMKRPPLFFNDHKEAKADHAVVAIRIDSPEVDGKTITGQWKLFFDASLLRHGIAKPYELYNLQKDQQEATNLINNPELKTLIEYMTAHALQHRNAPGHRYVPITQEDDISFDWDSSELKGVSGKKEFSFTKGGLTITLSTDKGEFTLNNGLGINGKVDNGEAIVIRFDKDVVIDSAALVSKGGVCGGFYQLADKSPLAIYCIDADIDSNDQSGILSDIGLLRKGETLKLDSSPHFGTETPGAWVLQNLKIRLLK